MGRGPFSRHTKWPFRGRVPSLSDKTPDITFLLVFIVHCFMVCHTSVFFYSDLLSTIFPTPDNYAWIKMKIARQVILYNYLILRNLDNYLLIVTSSIRIPNDDDAIIFDFSRNSSLLCLCSSVFSPRDVKDPKFLNATCLSLLVQLLYSTH